MRFVDRCSHIIVVGIQHTPLGCLSTVQINDIITVMTGKNNTDTKYIMYNIPT